MINVPARQLPSTLTASSDNDLKWNHATQGLGNAMTRAARQAYMDCGRSLPRPRLESKRAFPSCRARTMDRGCPIPGFYLGPSRQGGRAGVVRPQFSARRGKANPHGFLFHPLSVWVTQLSSRRLPTHCSWVANLRAAWSLPGEGGKPKGSAQRISFCQVRRPVIDLGTPSWNRVEKDARKKMQRSFALAGASAGAFISVECING